MSTLVGLVIAFAVGVIAFFNWMTAYQRIVVDVFDRRFAVYEELRRAVSLLLTHGDIDNKTLFDFIRATNRARFLFGPEVVQYLEDRYKDLVKAQITARASPRPVATEEEAKKAQEEEIALFDRLGAFYKETDKLFGPYMRLHQKLTYMWWPFPWPF